MFAVPLYYFFILYAALALLLLAYFLLNLSHLFQTKAFTYVSFGITLFIILLVALNFLGAWYYLQGTDWTQATIIGGEGIIDQFNNQY